MAKLKTMSWWQKILYAIAVGTPCFFLSEGFFWARWRVNFNPITSIQTWLIYSLVTYTVLVIIDRFKVQDFWGVFLVGAVYGWLVEGIVVGTVYEDFPLGISFTGLGWHALISIGVGLYILPRILRQDKPGRIAWMAAAAGLLYAVWAIWWWLENPANINPPIPWLIYSGGMTLLSMLGFWAADRLNREHTFNGSRTEMIVLLVVWTAYFLFNRYFTFWWGLLVLPPLMLLTFAALHQGKKAAAKKQTTILDSIRGQIPLKNLLSLLLMPLTAAIIYMFSYFLGLQLPTHQFFYIILTPAGFILYIIAVVKLFQRAKSIKTKNNKPQQETNNG